VPFGILNLLTGLVWIVLGTSYETSDFWVDCLGQWWAACKGSWPGIKRLVIRLDNGPASGSNRTQFLKRLAQLATQTGLEIRLIYTPPYHSKYNPIERVWGALEHHWNVTLLQTLDIVREWTQTMTWEGTPPTVQTSQTVYAKGVKVSKAEMSQYRDQIQRSATLPKWDVTITPKV
jgi:Rhodopirellula transposase DDE domain